MPNRYEQLVTLITRYFRQELTIEEQAALNVWLAERPENRAFIEGLEGEQHLQRKLQAFHEADRDRLWTLIQFKLAAGGLAPAVGAVLVSQPQTPTFRRWLPYAAAILITTSAVMWMFVGDQVDLTSTIVNLQSSDIQPGGNRAVLTLIDGRTITLDEARDGIVIRGDEITYNDGNPLAHIEESEPSQVDASLLELSTPKGGTYQITLSDGTKVWMNAASSLKYPRRFGSEERLVELKGEAYFSVEKDSRKPFKVISAGQEIQVLGTEFNIAAYSDENETKTTLVEGAVRISYGNGNKTLDLSSGEQGVLGEGGIKKINVDISAVTAWKAGRFSFDNKTFTQIMNEMARWYDIDVAYEGTMPNNSFIGDAYRTDNLRTVLRFLESSDIQYRLEEETGGRYRLIIRSGKEVTSSDF